MLAPDSRTLLMDQLAPPPGATFDTAVATTFTLDLTATLLPTLAFTGFHLASGTSDPIATLESIRSTADRIDVFCQAGAIAVPEQAPDLLAFLEPMVHPVQPPGAGLFHPKVWFVRYVDGRHGVVPPARPDTEPHHGLLVGPGRSTGLRAGPRWPPGAQRSVGVVLAKSRCPIRLAPGCGTDGRVLRPWPTRPTALSGSDPTTSRTCGSTT